ncbi:macrophage mannose receptor 1-like [Thunnus thynnus]|uniref:macrophage mannose receptor 1-like n=1 Tax=Thunnus thynnus TaxID=8237 RepID=UPI003528F383
MKKKQEIRNHLTHLKKERRDLRTAVEAAAAGRPEGLTSPGTHPQEGQGWSIFSTCRLHQYHFVAEPMNWTEAQNYCRETYTDLATIENTEDMNQLINTVSSAGYNSQVWIGLYRVIDWKWSDGYRGSGAEYRNWKSGYPYLSINVHCVLTGCGHVWWDHYCEEDFKFVCYNGTQLDPQFVFVNQEMSWFDAQRYCRENFIDLATERNNTESREVGNSVPCADWAWIGLHRDPGINWSDGSAYSFPHWGGSFSVSESLRLVKMMCGVQESRQWMFKSCEERFPFVCYSIPPVPVKRRVVKLRMKVQDSSVDLNDPAVKANILKKFQDRLKEQGVSGVTLKWREQPDGKVFHKEGKEEKKKKRKKTEL